MQKEIITIAGALGGGKSSTAKLIAKELGYEFFSSGDLFRQIAQERGLTIEEINTVADTEISIDHDVDERLRALGKQEKIVIDSRLAYHWIPESFKVYLNLDTRIAAERIFKQIQSEGRQSQSANSVEELIQATEMRKKSEHDRYKRLYGFDLSDLSSFDLVINTAEHDLNTVVQIVLTEYRKSLQN
jgi:CMP/dCMP kinase